MDFRQSRYSKSTVRTAGLLSLLWIAGPATSGPGIARAEDCHAGDHASHSTSEPTVAPDLDRRWQNLPDVPLVDQNGREVRFSDLTTEGLVAMNFIFTSCTTVCPPMGALFARLQHELERKGVDDVSYLSISIDPGNDTPERLKSWSERFAGTSRWRLVTGKVADVDRLLKGLGVFSALKEDHAPLLLVADPGSGRIQRAHGLAPVAEVAALIQEMRPEDDARAYFTDTRLVDHHGENQRFYSDLIRGKTVVINPFFAACTGSCPVMHRTLAQVRDALGDRIGRDVFLLSITVDPDNDTPESLKRYAQSFGAGPGWSFLTGPPENVRRVLARLGQAVEQREAHQTLFLVGNDRTGLWQKVFGLDPAAELQAVLKSVADDHRPVEAARAAGPATFTTETLHHD